MGSNIDYLIFCPQTTAECREIRAFLRPAPKTTNSLRRRGILQTPHLPHHIHQSPTEMPRRHRHRPVPSAILTIFHQHERVNLRPETLRQRGHPSEKPPSILVCPIDCLTTIAPAHHRVPAITHMHSQSSRHIDSIPQFNSNVACPCLTPLPLRVPTNTGRKRRRLNHLCGLFQVRQGQCHHLFWEAEFGEKLGLQFVQDEIRQNKLMAEQNLFNHFRTDPCPADVRGFQDRRIRDDSHRLSLSKTSSSVWTP